MHKTLIKALWQYRDVCNDPGIAMTEGTGLGQGLWHDYGGSHEQVMAPVRETAAQAVGAAIQPLPVACAQALLALLHQLIKQQQWDVRHGGLLGLKYLLAARPNDSPTLKAEALPAAILGLQVHNPPAASCLSYL